jgi:hypothetical protein
MTYFARKYIDRVNQYGNQILKAHGMKKGDDPEEYLEENWKSLLKATQKNKKDK